MNRKVCTICLMTIFLLMRSEDSAAMDFSFGNCIQGSLKNVVGDFVGQLSDLLSSDSYIQSQVPSEKVKRKKREEREHQESYRSAEDSRIDDNMREIESKREIQQSLSGTDRVRNVSIENTDEKKLTRTRNAEKYSRKGDTQITENKLKIEERRERAQTKGNERGNRLSFLRLKQKREDADRRRKDERRAAEQRIENAQLRIERKRARQEQMNAGRNSRSEKNAKRIAGKKKDIEITNREKELDSSNQRFDARKEAFDKKKGTQKAEEEYLSVPGTETLKEGVTENSYKMGNKMITERVVKVGNKVDKYKKVVSKTAIYYFCNDRSITEETWRKATLAQQE